MDLYLENFVPVISYWMFCCFFPTLYPTAPDILTYNVPNGWKKTLVWWKSPDNSMFSDSESAEMTEALLISVNAWNGSVNLLLPHLISAEP